MKKRKLSVNEFFYDNSFEDYTIVLHGVFTTFERANNGRIYPFEIFQQQMEEHIQRLAEFRQNLDAHRVNIEDLQDKLDTFQNLFP